MQLAEPPFFKLFPEPQARALQATATVREHAGPKVLFEEGDQGASMYLVLAGEVEISGLTATGSFQTLASMEAGSFFGEFAAVDGGPRSARASIPLRATLAEIPGTALLQAMGEAPASTTQAFVGQMIQRIRSFQHRFFTDIVRSQKMLLVGELTNSILHDLKSPLSIITGTAEVLQDKHRDMETQHLCELIGMQAKRVQDMCREVLDFVRGNTTLVQKQVNLKDVFPYFALLNCDYFRRQGVELRIEPADIELCADPDKLVRVLQNLTNNAAQAMLFGGQINVSAREAGDPGGGARAPVRAVRDGRAPQRHGAGYDHREIHGRGARRHGHLRHRGHRHHLHHPAAQAAEHRGVVGVSRSFRHSRPARGIRSRRERGDWGSTMNSTTISTCLHTFVPSHPRRRLGGWAPCGP